MNNNTQRQREIEGLEQAFWQSMVDGKANVATAMLTEPAVMVSGHGALKFDHATYEKMAAKDEYRLVGFKLSKMDIVFPRDDLAIATYHAAQTMETQGSTIVKMEAFDSSTWIRLHEGWKCVAHTESLQAPTH
jgi:ketosteroid isomerase-like protein